MKIESKLLICTLITILVIPMAHALTSDGAGTIYIPTNKNLGLGTKNPQAKVHINGNILIQDGSEQNGYVLTSDANGLASWQPAPAGGSEWIDAGSFLYPADNMGAQSVIIGGTTIPSADIVLNPDGSAVFNEQGNSVNFRVKGDSDQNLLVVNGTANQVGIGIAETSEILTINGAMAFTKIIAPSHTANFGKVYVKSSDSIIYYKDDSGNEYDLTAAGVATPAGSNGHVQFNTGDAFDSSANFFWENGNGKLALGHSSPNTVLDINGAFTYRAVDGVEPDSPDNNASVLWLSDGSTANGDAGDTMVKTTIGGVTKTFTLIDFDSFYDPTYNGLTLNGLTANRLVRTDANKKLQSETVLIVAPAGNVGVGTATPSALLDIGGGVANYIDGVDDVLIRDDLEVGGDVYGSNINISGTINSNIINGVTITGTSFFGGTFNGTHFGDGSNLTGMLADAAGSAGWIQFNNGSNFDANVNLFWEIFHERLGLGHSSPDTVLDINGAFTYRALDGVEPDSPDNNASVLWLADGSTANGDAGDTMVKTTINGETKTFTLIDFDKFNDPTYNGLTLMGLMANRLVRTDANKKLQSETVLIVDPSGNVGVGTATPSALLDIGGGVANYIDGVDDVLISDDLEVDGDIYGSNINISGTINGNIINGVTITGASFFGGTFNGTLVGDGSGVTGITVIAAGNNGWIQFNNGSNFGANGDLYWDIISSRLALGHSSPDTVLDINGAFTYRALDGVEPDSPDNNASVLWLSDGSTANGDAGDTMVKTTVGGITKTFTLIDFDGFYDPIYNGLILNGLTANRLVITDANKKLQSESNIYIDGGGNVGIGITSPNEKLTVNGTVSLNVLGSAPAATAGFGKLYANSSSLFFKNAAGTEYDLIDISPAGLNTQIQFNNLGTFGASSNLTWDGTNLNTLRVRAGLGSAALPSYSFTGDLDTGIYSPGANSLAFSTGGVQRFVINSAGNLGISQANPGAKMELNGTLAYTPSVVTNVIAGTGIIVNKTVMKVQGSGGPVDISANPQISVGVDGQYLIIKGSSNTNTVKLEDGAGLTLEGGIPFVLGDRDTITLIYDASSSTWLETSRSNKI
jgi:hypothetical protein